MTDPISVDVVNERTGALTELLAGADRDASLSVFKDVFNAMEGGVILWDEDLKFVLCNERYYELALPQDYRRLTPGDCAVALGKDIFSTDFYVLPDETDPNRMAEEIAETVRSYVINLELERQDGIWTSVSSKKTALGGYLLTFEDITDRKRAEAAEQKRWDILKGSIESLEEGFSLWDADFKLVMCNQKYMDIVAPFRDTPFEAGISGEQATREAFHSGHFVLAQGMTEEEFIEHWMTWAWSIDGAVETAFTDGRIVEVSAKHTDLGGVLITAVDKTEEMRAEQLLSDAISRLPVGVGVESSDGTLTHCNTAFATFYDLSVEELMSLEFEDRMRAIYPKVATVNGIAVEGDPIAFHRSSDTSQRDSLVPIEASFKDGRHYLLERAPSHDDGRVVVMTDITKLKAAEQNRLASINDAIEATGEALVLYDRDGKYVLSNQAYHDMFWIAHEPPYSGETVEAIFKRLLDADFYALPDHLSKDEFFNAGVEVFYNHGKNFPMNTNEGRFVLASSHKTGLDGYLLSFRDITEERRAEERKLEAVNEALDAVDDPLALFTSERTFVLANKAWFEMLKGYYDPEPGEDAATIFQSLLEDDFYRIPDGFTKQEFLDQGINAMENFLADFPLYLHDGRLHLGNSRKTDFGGFLLSYRDITDQRQAEAELEQQREVSHQNEKLSALGELLAGVAHELNNPLSVVFGYAQMLQGKVDDPVISKRIDMIGQSAERAAKIVKTFLAMARQRPTKVEICSLNDAIETALEVSTYALTANGTKMVIKLDETVPNVMGDFDQLAQVFTNLIVNAGHALEQKRDKGILTIRSFYDALGDYTVVEVRDNGPGIPKDIQTRIFEPFFTTKEVGKGTGVGLAFSHRIVDSHGGRLELESTIGKGARFYVKIRSTKATAPVVKDESGEKRRQTGKQVLVIDDEVGVAQIVSDILTESGFSMTLQTSPTDALRLLENAEYDAIICDFKMPEMNGKQFFNALKVIAPECAERIGFMTGDAMSSNVQSFFKNSRRPYLEKPIIAEELVAFVNRLCNHD